MVHIQNLSFAYPDGRFHLDLPELQIKKGEICGITGPSGYGKSTVLSLIAGILQPDRGRISVDGQVLSELSERERRQYRLRSVGFIFQDFELLEYLSIFDNIAVSRFLGESDVNRGMSGADYSRRVGYLASLTGIEKHLGRYPSHLSRGERQRVALCRALMNRPALILADEATVSLDPVNRDLSRDILIQFCREEKATLLEATHDRSGMERFDRIIDLPQIAETAFIEDGQ